jgi:hypothetical protein
MATDRPILTYTLEDVLTRFEQKADRQFTEVNQKYELSASSHLPKTSQK